jgi:CCR4-NOT transcription complex subunit 2
MDDEFELGDLGIDLQATEPLLPNVYYVASDAPLIKHAQFPMPKSYRHIPDPDPLPRVARFSDELLLFLFYTHARDLLQQRAGQELTKRRIVYDEKERKWFNSKHQVFDVDVWGFVPRS